MPTDTGKLMSRSRFVVYKDYFTTIAESGLEAAKALTSGISAVQNVDVTTYSNVSEAASARNSLLVDLQSSYEQIFTTGVALSPMSGAFRELSDHIQFHTDQNLNTYLENRALKVSATYAKIHRLSTGETIDIENIS